MSESSLLPFYKTPSEKYTVSIDFTGRLPVSVTLASVVFSAVHVETGANALTTVLQATPGSVDVPNNLLKVNFKDGGEDQIDYLIQALVTLSDGSVLEEVLLLKVRALFRRP